MISYLQEVTADSAALAAAVAGDPTTPVVCYDGWTLEKLGVHVGQIHRWVIGIVASRAVARPDGGFAEPPPLASLPEWLVVGAEELVEVLAAADVDEPVWTFSRTHDTVAFWRRRMALETALHRWDAEHAIGKDPTVPEELALEGVEESLDVYMSQRLEGAELGGAGQRVHVHPADATGWTVTVRPDGLDVIDGGQQADATITGTATELWLLLGGRVGLDRLDVAGDRAAAELLVAAAASVPGPAD